MLYIGLDDTDMPGTRGTGHLARQIACELSGRCDVRGVSRHQLLRDPRVPMTKNNSANVIHIVETAISIHDLAGIVEDAIHRDFFEGSDPGLCVASEPSAAMTAFGQRAKASLVTQEDARSSVADAEAVARSVGGTGDGIIGAVAGVGLAASGNDGRFVQIGSIRDLTGALDVNDLLQAGIVSVRTLDGSPVTAGQVLDCDKVRPEIIEHQSVVIVSLTEHGAWQAVRRD